MVFGISSPANPKHFLVEDCQARMQDPLLAKFLSYNFEGSLVILGGLLLILEL